MRSLARNVLALFSLLLISVIANAQTAKTDIKSIDFNYVLLYDTIPDYIAKPVKANEPLQLIFYPDSIPSSNLLVPQTGVSQANLTDDAPPPGSREVIVNPWIKDFPIHEYKILSISNTSTLTQKLFFYGETYFTPDFTIPVLIKLFVVMQAKNESGDWVEIKSDINKHKPDLIKSALRSLEKENVLIKLPTGDFETDIRFKLLVNAPPDFPIEKYIYSNVFRGKINKELLSKK